MSDMLFKILLAPFCASVILTEAKNDVLDWWQTSVVYQIHTRSFKDSNSDGIGDLKGIEEKAEYLKDLGIGAIWLNPIYESPMADMGYDISNFTNISPIFGTMDDFDLLRDKLRSLGIKLIMDFVPNHSSIEHEWFNKSVYGIDPYADYYVWKDPKSWINETTPVPPNNWIGPFQESMWTYHPKRKQFYLHQFTAEQPDLNYRSSYVLKEIEDVLRFWLDKKVDGFRMDAIIHLVEDDRYLDEPIISNYSINGKFAFEAYDHLYTQNHPENFKIARKFREILDSYAKKDGQTRIMMTENHVNITTCMKWYGTQSQPIAQMPFNFYLMNDLNDTSNAVDFQTIIHSWIDNMPKGSWANWVLGNHDLSRTANRFDSNSIDALNMLLLLLPGTPITYNGEEIGMEDTKVRWDQAIDKMGFNVGPKLYRIHSRDPARTPFQWDTSRHAGFSDTNGSTWLPVNPNYYRINVQSQKNNPRSHYNVYKKLTEMRSKETFRRGDFKSYVVSKWIFAFQRNLSSEIYIIVMNLNNKDEFVCMNNTFPSSCFDVTLVSANSEYNVGNKITTKREFGMRPKSAIVFKKMENNKFISPYSN